MVFIFKIDFRKGFTFVELIIILAVISILSGLITALSPDIIEKANRAVDESDVRNLNTATFDYKTTKKVYMKSDVFEGLHTDAERMQILFDTRHISNVPVPNVEGNAFIWDIASQRWIISGDHAASGSDVPGNVVKSSEIEMGTGGHSGFIKGSYSGGYQDIIIPGVMDGIQVTQIYQDSFSDKSLTSVVIEEGIARIHARAFLGNDLTEIVLPSSVKRIDYGAFMGNDITKVTIGADVFLEGNVFRGSNSFKEAYEAGGAGTYKFVDGQWIKE